MKYTKDNIPTDAGFCFFFKDVLAQWTKDGFPYYSINRNRLEYYKTAEHFMMASKAYLFHDYITAEAILKCDTPREAQLLGRQVKGFNQAKWDKWKYRIVKIGNIHKGIHNPKWLQHLKNTTSCVLVECNPNDTVWGIGLDVGDMDRWDPALWKGENLLGFALMEVRDILTNK